MSTIFSDNSAGELFADYECMEIPSEYNPFCNSSENISFNENYSHILPAFFFRNKKCRKKPSYYEKKNLRYFYNTTGVILTAKLMVEISACLIFYIIMFLCSYSLTSSLNVYYSVLSDSTVRYAFKTIVVIIATLSVFLAGCRFSVIPPSGLLKKCESLKTTDIVLFFMAGLFAYSLQNTAVLFDMQDNPVNPYEKDITQIVMVTICNCLVIPVSDGLIFRGIVLKNLSRASQGFGIIASSFLCAISSCSFSSMIPAFVLSVILSKLTVKSNTIIPSVLIHITVNISNAVIFIYSTLMWDSDLIITKIWTIITLVTGGIFAFILAVKHPLPKINALQRRRTLPLFFTSVFIILMIPFCLVAAAAEFLVYLYM